ncbi:MAG: ATP-binding domain-containing protein [Negativicutes bacterium]|jgi:exodeoxyribonuclease V alpha subunit
MVVEFYGNSVLVEIEGLRDIQLAYAITVHKSQGSEYLVVLLVLCREHAALLSRTILYTAVTRAKHRLIVIGSKAALNRAVENERSSRRWTTFETKLRRLGDEN